MSKVFKYGDIHEPESSVEVQVDNIDIANFPSSFNVSNFPTVQEVHLTGSNSVAVSSLPSVVVNTLPDVKISQMPAVSLANSSSIQVTNFPSSFNISNLNTIKPYNPRDQLLSGSTFGSGVKLTLAILGSIAFQIRNPAGSGKNLELDLFEITTDVTRECVVYRNATVNSSTTRTIDNLFLGNTTTPVGQVLSGTTGVTGGTLLPYTVLCPSFVKTTLDVMYLIPPGTSLTVVFSNLVNLTSYINVIWRESNA